MKFSQNVLFAQAWLFIALTALIFCPTTRVGAAPMAYEGFNYSTGSGNLTGLSGGYGWNGAWQGVNNGSSSVQSSSATPTAARSSLVCG